MEPIISYKKIAQLALPIILAQSVVLMNGMIDLAFIGPFGAEAIAAVSVANAICAVLLNFLEGFRIGTTVLIAKAAGSSPKITAVVNTGLFLAACVGLALAAAAPGISSLVYHIVDDEHLRYYGMDYLKIWLWTMPLILFNHVLTGLFRGQGNTATPLYSTATICLLNACFAYLFVYGGFGFPGLGVKGAALGTLLANFLGLLLIARLAFLRKITAGNLNWKQPFLRQAPEYIALAADIGMNTGFTLLALLLFVVIIKQLGAAALATHQITLQVFNFAYLPAVGFLITASIVVPRLLEPAYDSLLLRTVNRICQMSFGFILLTSSLLFIFADNVSRFFSPADQLVAEQAVQTLRLVCFGQLFSSVYMVLRGVLTACKDTRFIMYEGLISGYLIFLPLGYLGAIQSGYGVFGGYMAFLAWCIVDCMALAWRFYLNKGWRQHAGVTIEAYHE